MPSYLGQNFLKDSTYTIFIAQRVKELCERFAIEQCIEIGPGKGALTKKLMAIVEQPLILLEKDETLVPYLQEVCRLQIDAKDKHNSPSTDVFSHPQIYVSQNHHIHLLLGDALQQNMASLLEKNHKPPQKTIVVGNLPYYITSPLITKFFGGGDAQFPVGVFMVQKEVADKIRTDAGKKSFLRWLLNYQYDVKCLKTVPAKAFSPAPKVQSAIFSLIAKPQTPCFSYQEMIRVLDHISKYKRKTLGKCRKMATPELTKKYPLPEDLAGKRLEEIGLVEMERILAQPSQS